MLDFIAFCGRRDLHPSFRKILCGDDDFVVINDRGLFAKDRIDPNRYKAMRVPGNSILPSMPVTDFPVRTITTCEIDYATAVANGFPGGGGGGLITYRFSADTVYPNHNKQDTGYKAVKRCIGVRH